MRGMAMPEEVEAVVADSDAVMADMDVADEAADTDVDEAADVDMEADMAAEAIITTAEMEITMGTTGK